jgi:3,4-dihydroxy 2-butanone 4-phosphate synthase/GTP cyclohydrolase II
MTNSSVYSLDSIPGGGAAIVEHVSAKLSRHAERNRPAVTISYAQSIDGSISARTGRPLAISGDVSRVMTHALRAVHESILVGIGTVLSDDPALDVRLVQGNNPQPIILDSRLRFPFYSRMLTNGRRPWIAAAREADGGRREALEKAGARVFQLPPCPGGGVDLDTLLKRLADIGIRSILVEGGAQVITSFLAARFVDQVVITIAPLFLGGYRALDRSVDIAPRMPRLRNVSYQRLGADIVLRGEPDWD